jgi:hypothetical protein
VPIIAEMRLALPQLRAFAGYLPLDAAPVRGMDEEHRLIEVGYDLRESAAGGTQRSEVSRQLLGGPGCRLKR